MSPPPPRPPAPPRLRHPSRGQAKQADEDAAALGQHNADLASQLQHLLKKTLDQQYGTLGTGGGAVRASAVALIGYGGEEATARDVISEHLLTFEDVGELQTRNAQLLKVRQKAM